MADAELLTRAKTLLDQLSEEPRFAGSPEEAKARARCRKELEGAGFTCTERPFEYSQWPGRWGPPLAAGIQAATILAVARTSVHQGALAALVLGAALFSALMFASSDAKRRWTTEFPLQRARSVNLEATRGNPGVWLVAHIDSKSQTVPMLIRIASAIALSSVSGVALLVLVALLAGINGAAAAWPTLEIACVVAAIPSVLCFVRNDSRGAVDNASGVVAVVLASQLAPPAQELGVLITSGEELGLAGARVWAAGAKRGMTVINCDTLDDSGGWRCMYSGSKPARVAAAAETIFGRLGLKVAVGRFIPGILADSMAFADRGVESVTVSRGTLGTLARIHTRRDNSTALRAHGVGQGAALLSALAKELG